MSLKISEYTTEQTTLDDTDKQELSTDTGGGTWQTRWYSITTLYTKMKSKMFGDFIETILGTTDDKVPTSKAVSDAIAGITTYFELTQVDFEILVSANGLQIGTWYKVTGLPNPIYGTIDALVQAISTNGYDYTRFYITDNLYMAGWMITCTGDYTSPFMIDGHIRLSDPMILAYSGGIRPGVNVWINGEALLTTANDDGTSIRLDHVLNVSNGTTGTYDPNTTTFTPDTTGGVVSVNGSMVNNADPLNPIINSDTTKQDVLTADNTHTFIDGLTAISTPVDADRIMIVDNSASLSKKLTWANIKATLKTYFDTLYQSTLGYTPENVANKQTDLTASATKYPTVNAVNTGLATKITANTTITGATKTKITYDTKGLVTSGADATTADIADSINKRYVTDAQLTVIGNTSGTNTGDQTSVSGNAGTATTLQTSRNIDGQAFNGSSDITVIAPGTHAATSKATPVDADELPLVDSAASNVLKKLTWANLKTTLANTFISSSNNLSDLASATTARINLGLLNRLPILAENATDGTVSSGTSNTYSTGVLITPGMIDVDTSIDVVTRVRKTGTAGTSAIRIYANTTNDLSGSPILLRNLTGIGATALFLQIEFQLAIKVKNGTGAGTEVLSTSNTSSFSDVLGTTVSVTTAAIDWTSNVYIVVACQCTSGSDSMRSSLLKVRR